MDERELEFKTKWAELAAAKLRADSVDSNDLQAVRKALLATVGCERLYQYWLEVMAAIDKIYGTVEQWDELHAWCERDYPQALQCFYFRDGYSDGQQRPIAQFPESVNRVFFLMAYQGTPLPSFLLARLAEQYRNGFFLKPKGRIALVCLVDIQRVVRARVNARPLNKPATKGIILDGDMSGRTIERETGGLWRLAKG